MIALEKVLARRARTLIIPFANAKICDRSLWWLRTSSELMADEMLCRYTAVMWEETDKETLQLLVLVKVETT